MMLVEKKDRRKLTMTLVPDFRLQLQRVLSWNGPWKVTWAIEFL